MLLMPMAILMLDSQEDQRFMAELYQAHLPRMLAVARRYLPEGTEAEDAVSDSVMALIRALPQKEQLVLRLAQGMDDGAPPHCTSVPPACGARCCASAAVHEESLFDIPYGQKWQNAV